jgi:hypothetical protein
MYACRRREVQRQEAFLPEEDPGEVPEMSVCFGGTR